MQEKVVKYWTVKNNKKVIMGLDGTYQAHHFIFSVTFYYFLFIYSVW